MAKIGILLPYENMLDLVDQAIAEPELAEIGRNIVCKKLISTEDAVNEARLAVDAGAEILIARGYQAFLIKKYTNIPLVEMRLHTQEIGSLLKRAKSLIKKEKPHVALLVFRNMVRDMEELSELFDVQLTVHYLEGLDNIGGTLHSIASDEVDMIIGGHAVCREAETIGLLAIRYGASVVSVREALFEADRMSFAIDTEKHNSAQFETLLDTTFNGIIKINESAQITVINRIVEDLAGQDAESVKGLPINEVFPGLENTGIQDILDGKVDTFTTTINIRKQLFVLMIAPIQLNGQIKGAILSLEKILPAAQRDFRLQKDMYLNGYSADMTFDRLVSGDGNMQRQLELAKRYALSDRPVLIYSGEGSEYFWISQAIHNNSRRKSGPFLRINVPAIRPELQEKDIFGTDDTNSSVGGEKKAAVVQANMGTLFLKGIESLCMEAQYRLVRSFQQGSEARSDFQGIGSPNVRFIIQSGKNLKQLVEEGSFCEELFYMLQGLTITVPDLTDRPKDLEALIEKAFSGYIKQYGKYLVLTQGAKKELLSLPWPGNRIQLNVFLERLVLDSDRRSVDEVQIRKIYNELFPKIDMKNGQGRIVVYRSQEADEIREILEKHEGNRSEAAKELGISTTTLWRKMKKFDIREDFS